MMNMEIDPRPSFDETAAAARPQLTEGVTRGVVRLLWGLGFSPMVEFKLSSRRRIDVAGLDGQGRFLFVEVKSSPEDFRADGKWHEYPAFCDWFYFAVPPGFPHDILPEDGRMTIQSSVGYHPYDLAERGKKLTFELARFIKFMITEIFPGGYLPTIELVGEHSADAGFTLTREQSLQPHYARTLDHWSAALQEHRDEAIAVQSEEVYDRYMHYLTGCADSFRKGYTDVNQFTLVKQPAS